MADLAITHYRFRLVRRGWSRGVAGQRVIAAARERLPSAIAARLADAWPEGAGDASEPVRVKLRVRFGELAQACTSDEALAALVARLMPIEEQVNVPAIERARDRAQLAETVVTDGAREAGAPDAFGDPASVSRVLLDWHARRTLAAHLASFDEPALEAWHDALLASMPSHAAAEPSNVSLVRERIARHRVAAETARAEALRRRIAAVIDVVTAPLAPSPRELASVLDELLPLPPAVTAKAAMRAPMVLPPPRVASPARPPIAATRRDRSVSSVLPFLLLQPLRRIGYLDALAAAFAAAGRTDELPAFATALAYKVLAPPARGWRRDPRAVEDAATFAGLDEPLRESALTALAEHAAAWTSPLDAVVASAVLGGHDPDRPLLVIAHERDHLLVEPDGLFPIAWNDSIPRVLAGSKVPVAVAAAAAEPALLRELETRNIRFVTDAPPTRDEPWRRLRARRALWSNDGALPDAVVVEASHVLLLEHDARELEAELSARASVVLAQEPVLERSVALAVAVALGAIAQLLWQDHEPTSPQLARRRFADLTARILPDARSLEVRLPLGPRRSDLSRRGLLRDVEVPWSPRSIVMDRNS